MAEGLFTPERLPVPGVPLATLLPAMVRILPRTLLRLDIAADAASARAGARNEELPDGGELWHRFFTKADRERANDPAFSAAMVSHEFAQQVRTGAKFPLTVPLDGGGTGFAIDGDGRILTNYHLVTAEIRHHRREAGALGPEVPCRSVRAQIAEPDGSGGWRWRDADSLSLIAHPPEARALEPDASGVAHPREDIALLRVRPAPGSFLSLSPRDAIVGEPLWMAGFPLRSARTVESRRTVGYDDADGGLRISYGRVTAADARFLETDLDGAAGNSGSPAFDAIGNVVGLFSRGKGRDMLRNAIEYGHVTRVLVRSSLVASCFGLGATPPVAGADD